MSGQVGTAAAGSRPFAGNCYELAACRLERLVPGEAADAGIAKGLAEMLAASQPWQRLGFSAGGILRYLSRPDPGLDRFCVRIAGQPSGLCCLRYPWLRGAYIELIGLDPTSRGKGVGHTVLAWMAAETRPAANNLWATVTAFNHAARRFYAPAGFVEVAILSDLVSHGTDDILIRKRLG